MEVKADARKFYEIECDAMVVGVYEGEKPEEGSLAELDKRSGGVISSLIENGELTGKAGETVYLHNPGEIAAKRLLLLGAGKLTDYDNNVVRRMVGTAARFLRAKNVRKFAFLRRSQLPLGEAVQAGVEGAMLSLWDPDKYKTSDKESKVLSQMIVATVEGDSQALEKGVERGRVLAEAANFARDVINEPSNYMTPTELARQAEELAQKYGLELDVLDEARMKELGMGALLGVAQGSAEQARLIVLTYTPSTPPACKETLAIVGKGVTFDTGGISIKPSEGMEKMKYDMAGGATTLAAMRAIGQLKPALNVIGIIPAVENMPGGRAQRPGDVVRSMRGKTIEVINTDAEGRLILCDAISYAIKLGATRIVDLATLTGAVSIALGDIYVAVLGNDDNWTNLVIQAGKEAGEKIWQLPLDRDYRDQIKSDIADIKNVGGRKAGTITAAYFLREFVDDIPWAHLDIAGTAWNDSAKPYLAVGPTGVCVRTLVNVVNQLASQQG